ncbi:hypothetical protein ACH5RR_014389 [Cinchona calisaya]|uniref:Uncharacterized protein n=1 Tax=Cinchona calisaya TaxID=153742 RepID=A0ABD3A2S0_9GENT
MALKSLLFVFAFVLLVSTTKVTSTEEDAIDTQRDHHRHPHHHLHHHHPHHHDKSPGHGSENPPMKFQTYPQPKAPAYPPKPAHPYHVAEEPSGIALVEINDPNSSLLQDKQKTDVFRG